MAESTRRSDARLIAYLQAAIVGISLSLVIIFGVILLVGTFPPYSQHQLKYGHRFDRKVHEYWVFGVPIPAYICWIAYAAFVVATGAQFWISIELSTATETRTAPKEALSSAIIWSKVTAGFFLLESFIFSFCFFAIIELKLETAPLSNLLFWLAVIFGLDAWMKYGCFSVVNKFIYELQMQSQAGAVV